jgi:hypothetical protein
VAYARFLDAQAAAGELSASEERFHRSATKLFQKGPWRERLHEPAWQLRLTAQGHALNLACVSYSPQAVRGEAASRSLNWHHFHYEAKTTRHGRYLLVRVPIWPVVALLILYPSVELALWRRVRWFWRATAAMAGCARPVGIGWALAALLLFGLGLASLTGLIVSRTRPIEWAWPTREYGERVNLRLFLETAQTRGRDVAIDEHVNGSEYATWAPQRLAQVHRWLMHLGLRLTDGQCSVSARVYHPNRPAAPKSCAACGLDLSSGILSRVPGVICPKCLRAGGRNYGWPKVVLVRLLPAPAFETHLGIDFPLRTPLVFALALLAAIVLFGRQGPYRRWVRLRRNQCIRCGYDLMGNASGVCPECGLAKKRRRDRSPP